MKLCEFFKKQFDNAKETAKHFEADSKYLVEVSGYEKGSSSGVPSASAFDGQTYSIFVKFLKFRIVIGK